MIDTLATIAILSSVWMGGTLNRDTMYNYGFQDNIPYVYVDTINAVHDSVNQYTVVDSQIVIEIKDFHGRGDINNDGKFNLADAMILINVLFNGGKMF